MKTVSIEVGASMLDESLWQLSPVARQVGQESAQMFPGLSQRKRSAVAAMYQGVSEFSHAVSECEMVIWNSVSRCDPVHELGYRGMTPPANDVFPEPAQCDLENGKHPNQIRPCQIVMAVTDVPYAETSDRRDLRRVGLAQSQEVGRGRSAGLTHALAGPDLQDDLISVHAAEVSASTSLTKACSLQGSGQ